MAETDTDIATLAEQFRADLETLGDRTPLWPSLCANPIEVHHVPAGPDDGPMDGTLMPDLVGWEHSAVRSAVPDWAYRDVTADVDGNTISLRYNIGGTLGDKQYSFPAELHLQVRDGRIIRLDGHVPEGLAKLVQEELVATGTFEMPTELIARAMESRTKTS